MDCRPSIASGKLAVVLRRKSSRFGDYASVAVVVTAPWSKCTSRSRIQGQVLGRKQGRAPWQDAITYSSTSVCSSGLQSTIAAATRLSQHQKAAVQGQFQTVAAPWHRCTAVQTVLEGGMPGYKVLTPKRKPSGRLAPMTLILRECSACVTSCHRGLERFCPA